jgi:eukaryotic-like serine/threonine-protein kinase
MVSPLSQGTRLGRYEIRSQLGAGGMGEVYLAVDEQLDRIVALKILPQELASDRQRLQRFVQEAKSVSALNHPHILTIFEIGEADQVRFIATEFIDGETLRQRLRNSPPELAEVVEIAIQAVSAMEAAHSAGIVHRDIKPENIMIRRDGYLKLLDFGLAKLKETVFSTDPEAPTKALVNTDAGTVMGTAYYMSPEQAKGVTVDARSDLWSLGVVIYEMITGLRPFAGGTSTETISLILQKEPAPLARFSHNVPSEMERIVSKALTKNREERYQTAKDLLIDLRSLKRKMTIDAEMDRTASTDFGGAADDGRAASTASPVAAPTASANSMPVASSAEYIVSQAKKHKLTMLIVAIVLALGLVALAVYMNRGDAGVAIDSIAVLPFENRSIDPDTEYLSEGLTESLIYRLSQLPNLKVSPTSLVFRYKGKQADAATAGNELGVNAVLLGRITQRGESLTISAELVDVRQNRLLWGEQYDRKMADLLTTQREIAQEIVEKLKLKVSGGERGLAKHYTESNEAYQLYLKGRFYWNKRTPEALQKAIDYFNQAIEKDSNFALAYAGLADCYVVPAVRQPPREVMPKAKAAARRALELDETLAEAHTSLGRVLAAYDWDWKGAEKEFKRAIELNPRYAVAHQWYGGWFDAMGRHAEAIAERKRAQELDPLSLVINFELGIAFLYAREYDQAIEQFHRTLEMDQNFPPVYAFLSAAYEQKGMYAEAIVEFRKAVSLKGGSEWSLARGGLGHVYAVMGKTNEARQVLDELKQLSTQEYVPATSVALVYAGLGEKDQAFTWLEKAHKERSFQIQWITIDPRWDSLRSDPRFADLVRRIGLP